MAWVARFPHNLRKVTLERWFMFELEAEEVLKVQFLYVTLFVCIAYPALRQIVAE